MNERELVHDMPRVPTAGWPTDEEAHAALLDAAEFKRYPGGRWTGWGPFRRFHPDEGRRFWFFHGSDIPRSYANALMVAKCCLYLEAHVTDTVDARHWYNLCQRVARLEEGARIA